MLGMARFGECARKRELCDYGLFCILWERFGRAPKHPLCCASNNHGCTDHPLRHLRHHFHISGLALYHGIESCLEKVWCSEYAIDKSPVKVGEGIKKQTMEIEKRLGANLILSNIMRHLCSFSA